MKQLIALLAFLALALPNATAATYGAEAISIPSVIAANSTTNVALTMDVRRNETSVPIVITLTGGTAATTNEVTLTFYQGVDGTTFASGNAFSTSKQTWLVYPNGATATTVSTNLPVNGCGYIQLYSVLNHASNSYLTNIVARYAVKGE